MIHEERIWSFNTENFRVVLECAPEPYPDLSWADAETLEKLESGEYVNCLFAVKVFSATGQELGADYLGNSVYADPSQFRKEHIGARGKWGSYFRDMVHTAIEEARRELAYLRSIPARRVN